MTELAEVRARLEQMVEIAEAVKPGVVLAWSTEQDLVDDNVPRDEAAFVAAASPDLLLRVAREALDVLNRHAYGNWNDCVYECGSWPCPEVTSVLRAWQP